MLLPQFDYHEPNTVKEACKFMAEFGNRAKYLAGGTDLLVNLKKKKIFPEHVICLLKIKQMSEISESSGHIKIGSCVTVSELTESKIIESRMGALKKGAESLGSHLVRNKATIGGNICNASPAVDLLPSLIVYDTSLTVESIDGKREIPVKDFFTGPGKTCFKENEILTDISVPIPPKCSGAGYIQLGKRKSSEINIVNVASYLEINRKDGTVKKARIALGSVGSTPVTGNSAKKILMNNIPDDDLFKKAGEALGIPLECIRLESGDTNMVWIWGHTPAARH